MGLPYVGFRKIRNIFLWDRVASDIRVFTKKRIGEVKEIASAIRL